MFILRKITGNGGELNFALGDSYSLILKDANPKEFKEVLSVCGHDAFEEDLYGFIGYGNSEFQMLFKKQLNYIMTENGKTFKNITSHEKIRSKNKESAESEKHFNEINNREESSGTQTIPGYINVLDLPYTISDIPQDSQPDARCSNDLLIDTDGTGKFFRVGFYVWTEDEESDMSDEGFRLYGGEEKELICGGMKWDYLPAVLSNPTLIWDGKLESYMKVK